MASPSDVSTRGGVSLIFDLNVSLRLKKWWQDIYDNKSGSRRRGFSKTGDFVALLRAHYADYDIANTHVVDVHDLDTAYS
jgi:hypothetical protein